MHIKAISSWVVGMLAMIGVKLVYASIVIPMYLVTADGQGKSIGTVKIESKTCGVLLTPDLHDLPPGVHGFHIHEHPSCGNNGMAAGGHFDPLQTGKHEGPYSNHGHLGDLPVLTVDQSGHATLPTLAPRFKLSSFMGRTLMIHAGSDNYSDVPEKLGGGGARIACGVIS